VPAVGISLGFERVVDLVSKEFPSANSLVIIYEDINLALKIQQQAIAEGFDTRIEKRVKNTKALLESMQAQGFGNFAMLADEQTFTKLEIKPLG